MHKYVEQGAEENQSIRERTKQMSPVLGDKEKAGDQ